MRAIQDRIKANKEKRFAASITRTKDRFGQSAFTPSDVDKAYLKNTLFGGKGPKNARQSARWHRIQDIQGGDPQNKSDLRFYKRQLNRAANKEAWKIMKNWTSSDMSVKDASRKAFGTSIIKPEVEQPSNAPDHGEVIQQIEALKGTPTYDYNKDLALLVSLQQQQSEGPQNQDEVKGGEEVVTAEGSITPPEGNPTEIATETDGPSKSKLEYVESPPFTPKPIPLPARLTVGVSKGNKINFDYFKYF